MSTKCCAQIAYTRSAYKGQIKNRTTIDERPKIVDERPRIGDWEVDTVIGKNHKDVIVTAVERKSKYMIACPVPDKSEQTVSNALINSLKPYQNKVHTLTGDNGKEFAGLDLLTVIIYNIKKLHLLFEPTIFFTL